MRLDPLIIQQQIANLLLQVPELAEDDVLRADMVEAETEAYELLRQLEARRREAVRMIIGISSDIKELDARLGRFERREQAMRKLMFQILELADLRKVELPTATLSVRHGNQKVIITDDTTIPDAYCRFKREADKAKIAMALKAGENVLGAELSNSTPVLAILTK